jgi:hypothetical protein
VPATAGLSIGTGEPVAGGADRRTLSGAVASAIVAFGSLVMRVRTVGSTGGASAGVVTAGVVGVGVVGVAGVASPGGGEAADARGMSLPDRADVLARATPAGAIAASASALTMIALAAIALP